MFTSHFGFIVDLIAEYLQVLRNKSFYSKIEHSIQWGKELDQRDKVRVRAVTSGLLKLIYPNEDFSLKELEECVTLAIELRRRVKEQLRKMGSVEFRKTNFSYIRKKDNSETFVTTPEMELASLYSPLDEQTKEGIGFTLGLNHLGRYSLYRIEVGLRKGSGRWNATGLAGKPIRDALLTVRDYIKANLKLISPEISEHDIKNNDVHVQIVDLMKTHQGSQTGLGFFITVLSKLTKISLKQKTLIVGEMTISGALIPIQNLAEIILIGKESGAKSILLPENSKSLLSQVPKDILEDIKIEFFNDPISAWNLAKSSNEPAEFDINTENDNNLPKEKVGNDSEMDKSAPLEPEHVSHEKKPTKKRIYKQEIEFQLPPVPVASKKYECKVILDGSNVARDLNNSKQGSIKQVLRLRDQLIQFGIPNDQIYIIFGAGLRHHIPEDEKTLYQALLRNQNINQAPAGQDDDYFIIEFAIRKDAFIVTNDFYKDYIMRYPKKRIFIRTHRISYSFLGDEIMLQEGIENKLKNHLI